MTHRIADTKAHAATATDPRGVAGTALLCTQQGPIAHIVLNRPGQLNAINQEMREALLAAIRHAAASAEVRSVVITGAGENFCAGGDMATLQHPAPPTLAQALERMTPVVACAQALLDMPKPVIAAVDGVAYGGGLGLALCADAVIATPRARLCASFTRLGLVPDFLASFTLPRLVGLQRARGLIYGAQEISGTQAHAMGMLSELAEPDHLQPRAMALAQAMGALPGTAFSLTKRALLQSLSCSMDAMAQHELMAQGIALTLRGERQGSPAHTSAP